VLAYLMRKEKMSLKDAFLHTRHIRSTSCPNRGFCVQLIEYELQLFGKNTMELNGADCDYDFDSMVERGQNREKQKLPDDQ